MKNKSLEFNENFSQLLGIKVVIFMSFFAMSLPYTILPDLMLHPHSGPASLLHYFSAKTLVMMVMSVYSLGMFIGAYTLGLVSDHVGKRKSLLLSLLLTAIAQLFCGLCIANNDLLLFILFRFVCGFCEGNISIARASIAVICLKEEVRKYHLGQANIALTLGYIMGPPMGALLAQHSFRYFHELPFFFASLFALFALVFCHHTFSEPARNSLSKTEKAGSEKNRHFAGSVNMAIFASCLIFLGVDTFYVFIPVFLTLSIKATPAMLAFTSVCVGVSNVLSNYFLLPRTNDWVGTKGVVISCAICLSVLLVLLAMLGYSYYCIFLLPLFGAVIALISPCIMTYISFSLSDERQGKLMGVLSGLRTLGAALIAFFFAILINIKITFPFMVGSISLLFGALLLHYIKLTPSEAS